MTPQSPQGAITPPDDSADPYEREAQEWLANVYQGDKVRQLSVRSIISGMLIGGVMSISNLYVGLKAGWGLGVTITACIIAYAVFKALEVIPYFRRNPFTILENYTMSSAASAAGYMSSAGLVSAIPALYLTTHTVLKWWEMMPWLAAVSLLGVFMAIPLKRQLINIDKLPFPTGLATAETLKSLHTAGREALAKAWSLFVAAILGAVVRLGPVAWAGFPEQFPLFPGMAGAHVLKRTSFGFESSMVLVAAGAIMGMRVGISLLVGAILYYGIIGYFLVEWGITGQGAGGKGITAWTLWPATAMMVASGLASFAFRWRTVLRAFAGLASAFRGTKVNDPLAHLEVPGSWFLVGTLVSGSACVVLGQWFFNIPWWLGILSVILAFVLSIVAARATGETDVTPIGAMGKISQLLSAAVTPKSISANMHMNMNLMAASITAGAASHSADLLTDLKSGYLLGGNPRSQTISQLFGVLAGTLFCVPAYAAIVGNPERLGNEITAPAAVVWASVAKIMAEGFHTLPKGALAAMIAGGVVGIVLACLEEFLPARWKKWLPSATGLGIAGVVPAYNSVSMFTGALIAWLLFKAKPKIAEMYTIPFSSGLIAGESLMGVGIAFVEMYRG